jgi:AraC-like DNA-binding protein
MERIIALEKSDIAAFSLKNFAPLDTLKPFVEEVSLIENDSNETSFRILPDGSPTIILGLTKSGLGNDWLMPDRSGLAFGGVQTRTLKKRLPRGTTGVSVRFKIGGAAPFFPIPLSEVANRHVHVNELWPGVGERLSESLFAAESHGERMALLQDALVDRLKSCEEFSSIRIVRATVKLAQQAGMRRVGDLAKRIGVSNRHLNRAFQNAIGISPKQFVRILRFQQVVKVARQNAALNWAEIAADTDYYDQSHLIAEFKRLTGMTPTTFTNQQFIFS